jgi:hypothetical protein
MTSATCDGCGTTAETTQLVHCPAEQPDEWDVWLCGECLDKITEAFAGTPDQQ